MKRKIVKPKRKISFKFGSVLAIVSIIGFLEIISQSFFEVNFGEYMGFLWLTVMGAGFILISNPKRLHKKRREDSISDITMLVIGILAVIAGVLSLPFIGIIHPVFLATKGVISIIAIIFIIIETWVIEN